MSDQNNKINKKVEIDLAELLKKDAPYLVEDGKVNIDKLKGLLTGKTTEKEDDRFYFNWAGKDKVFQAIQAPAYSTLAPQKDKSIGWDETENLMIVGENLETLKLLLKPYFGKIKVIYIDPPYNTGKDFIYKDDFSAPLKDYLERTGQKGANGERLTTNSETYGRYHSDWLNFMYPRLFMARNLLREDGLIFISIDENEHQHLRMLMDEVFGEDNFIAELVWQKKKGGSNDAKYIALEHEYVIFYAKAKTTLEKLFIPHTDEYLERYNQEDEIGRFYWDTFKRKSGKQYYAIKAPDNTKIEFDENNNRISWLRSEKRFLDDLEKGEVKFEKNGDGWSVLFKQREPKGKKPRSLMTDVGTTSTGSDELLDIFKKNIFDNPKPSTLIKHILSISQDKDAVVLDFFAGSGTTAKAVYELNKDDEGFRKYILVQIQEPVDISKETGKNAKELGFNSVDEICVERVKIENEKLRGSKGDIGFKVFKLSPSNFNLKEEFELTENKDLGELKTNYLKELGLYVDQPTVATANTLDIVYEIILKNGFSLNSKIEELKLGANSFYKVSDAENELEIHISLDAKIEDGSVEAIRTTEYKGKTFAFYDNALTDSQKINLNTFVKLQVI